MVVINGQFSAILGFLCGTYSGISMIFLRGKRGVIYIIGVYYIVCREHVHKSQLNNCSKNVRIITIL